MARALVLSGGGANGAYQVGALQRLLCDLETCYDLFVGTSVGALNCGYLSQYEAGHEKAAGQGLLRDVWEPLRGNGDIYRKHCYGLLWHLPVLWENSVYTTKPLKERVYGRFDPAKARSSGKELRVVGVSWDNGESTTWTQNDADITEGILASSSFPMFFDDVYTRGQWWTDGGVREIAPLREAIRLGADRIDVILCSPAAPMPSLGGQKPGKFTKLGRFIQILLDEVVDNDVAGVLRTNEDVKRGYYEEKGKKLVEVTVLRPGEDLGDGLDFDKAKNNRLVERGYEDARALIWDQ